MIVSSNVIAQPVGNLDPLFGNAGKVLMSFSSGADKAHGVAIQPDGKILISGYTSSGITGKDFLCARYKSDGTLDSTFGINGFVTTDIQVGSEDVAYGLALQSNGMIILAGYSDNGSNKDAALVRYQSNGLLDSSFGVNGIALTDFDSLKQDEIKAVKIHPLTGKIVVGGAAIISSSLAKPVVARYMVDGSLDTSFNSTGIRTLWVTSLDYQYLFSAEDLAIQPNGKISVAGWRDFVGLSWDSDYWVARINNDGSMDNTFSGDGVNVMNGGFNGHDRAYSTLLTSSNDMIVAGGGYISTLKYDCTFFDVSSNGLIGTMFTSTDFGSSTDDISYGLAQDINGKYVTVGSTGTSSSKAFTIMRLTSTGSLDNTFGGTGKLTATFGANTLNEAFDVAIQTDNKIVVVGYSGNDIAIARYLGSDQPNLNYFQLLSPANSATNQPYPFLLLDWQDALGATGYEVEIDTNSTFTGNPQTYSAPTSSYSASNLVINTKYYWRVRATDGTNWGQWTFPWSFKTNANYPSGINEMNFSGILIYPNPVQNILFIESSESNVELEYQLLDLKGSVLKHGSLTGKETSISTKEISSGSYFLRIGNETHSIKVSK